MSRGDDVRAMLDEQSWPPLTAGMLAEAARLLDRLDTMDELLTNHDDVWLTVVTEDGELQLVIDKLIDTTRALQLAYGRLVSELRQLGVAAKSVVELEDPDRGGGVDPLDRPDELAARRRADTA